MKKQHISAGADKNFFKKLEATDIFRKFASGTLTLRGCFKTLRKKVISITLPFDSRKSRKFTRISQWSVSDAHTLYYNRAWAAPAVLLIRVVREPTWAKWQRVGSRLLYAHYSKLINL